MAAAIVNNISQLCLIKHFSLGSHSFQFNAALTVTHLRFSRTLNNCKVPQIRYATPERLLQRLTDLRFLSIDFLNTFLLTYRVFADGVQV